MYKKYFNLLLLPLIICLAACENKQMNEMEDQHKAAAVKVIEVFDSGNVDELDAIIAEDAVDHQLDTSITKKTGLEGVKELFSYFHRFFPDMKTTIHSIAVSGDTVFIYSTSVGTTSEPFMGMQANQRHTISGVDILRFEGEKAVEHWGFIDVAQMMEMMQSPMHQDNSMMNNK